MRYNDAPSGVVQAFKEEHGADIANLYPRASACISDFGASLEHDVRLVRDSAGTPAHINIYGDVYDIDAHALTRVVDDPAYVERVSATN